MNFGIKNKHALITGGSKGIGQAIAQTFAAEGANVAICARGEEDLAAALTDLDTCDVNVSGASVDVADPPALKAWVEASAETFGGIDMLVCNVSALAVGDSPETWDEMYQTDMMHTVNAIAAALPYLQKSDCPSIVVVSSVSGFEVDFAAGSYGAIKAALIHYAKGLSRQLAAKGIRVNCVSPGNTYFDGGAWQQMEKESPEVYASRLELNPTGRFGTAQEVANGVVFLSSPVASRISGTNLVIDGALTVSV